MGEKVAIFLFCESVFVSGIIIALINGWELALISYVSLPVSTISMGIISWVCIYVRRVPKKREFRHNFLNTFTPNHFQGILP